MANLFILNWNPSKWDWPTADYQKWIRKTTDGKTVNSQWSVGRRVKGIAQGDVVLLLRQHSERGIIASGTFSSSIFQAPHWNGFEREANYAKVRFDTLVETDRRLDIAVLKREFPEIAWDRLQGSGTLVPVEFADQLYELWQTHNGGAPYRSPEEMPKIGSYAEGTVTKVTVNRFERDRRAREACIQHHGFRCSVCDVDFGEVYGALGKGFIHVHHLVELSTSGGPVTTDPINDLRPVCPNCHAMLHRKSPALSIMQLRARLKGRKVGLAPTS